MNIRTVHERKVLPIALPIPFLVVKTVLKLFAALSLFIIKTKLIIISYYR